MLDLAVAAVEDIKAQNVVLLDVRNLTTITDHMLICSGTSGRHVKSIADAVVRAAKEANAKPSIEGLQEAEWVLVDLGSVVVHIMQAQARAFYQLEKLWSLAEPDDLQARNPALTTP